MRPFYAYAGIRALRRNGTVAVRVPRGIVERVAVRTRRQALAQEINDLKKTGREASARPDS
jgi:hypothetical protein